MQYNYTYNQKQGNNKAQYRTLFILFAKLLLIIFITFLVMMINTSEVSAQAGLLDPSFNTADNGAPLTDGANGDVRTLALQPDGKIIIGGAFTNYGGTTVNRITRITTGGLADATFNNGGAGADGNVYKVVLQPDGKIIIAGKFNNYNGLPAGKIIRLNADGSKDVGFNAGTGFNDSVNIITLQADGKILVGGNFTTYNGVTTNYLVRLNADGTKDVVFNPATVSSTVNSIATQVDNKIIVGMQGSAFLTRLTTTGTVDPTFNVAAANITGPVKVIRLQTDGKVLVGGKFDAPNSSLIRLNTDATPDAGFTAPSTYEQVNVITLQADGKILVGISSSYGYLEKFYDIEGKKINRLNTNGSVDATFNYYFEASRLNQNIFAIAIQTDGKIISAESTKWQLTYRAITGPYYAGTKDPKIRRYNADGSDDSYFAINTVATGAARKINATAIQADGKILVGGYFYTFNGTIANHIVRLNTNGTIDPTFNVGTGFNHAVNSIAVQPDGKIIVGGYFTTFNGQPSQAIIRLNSNGSVDPGFTSTLQQHTWISSLGIQPDGKMMIGGGLITIKRLNANGTADTSFHGAVLPNLPYDVPDINSIVIQPDGKILVGGDFSRVSGIDGGNIYNLVRLKTNGLRDTTFMGRVMDDDFNDWALGTNARVGSIALQSNGMVVVGGSFNYFYRSGISPVAVNRLIRLTAGGFLDPTFNIGTGPNGDITSVSVLPNGKMLIAGNFTSYNGTNVGGLIRINANGSFDNTFNPGGTGANSTSINSVTVEPGAARFYISGDFTSYNASGKNRIARIFNDDAGASDCVVGTIAGPDRACQYIAGGTNAAYQITAAHGSTITWTVSSTSTMSIVNGQGTNQVNIHFANNFTAGVVYAKVVNAACSLNVTRSLTVKITAPSAPGAITASSNSVCSIIGTANTITYKINKVTSATSYNWSAQAGSTIITHPNGPGVNDTIINVSFANNFTSSQVTVQAVNGCGTSSTRILNVNLTIPAAPTSISGPTYVCSYLLPTPVGGPAVYTTPAVAGITYNWTIPAGSGSVTGQGTNSISFYFPAGFTLGSVSVTATNGCGTSNAKTMAVKASLPQTPGAITVANISACPNQVYTYSIAAIPVNATSILWNVPVGGTITAGQGTTTISVSYGGAAISGYVSLHSYNACGTSTVRKIAVSLAACLPGSPFAKIGGTNSEAAINPTAAIAKTNTTETFIDGMDVKVFPNPSTTEFTLEVITAGRETINVRILDIAGKFISESKVSSLKTVKLGAGLKTGTYLVEVRQGTNMKTTRVIKL